MLQERINELNSGIIEIKENQIFITGFFNADRLISHLKLSIDNYSSKGLYSKEPFNFKNIKDNALFIVRENNIVKEKIQYIPVSREQLQSKEKNNKIIVTLRRNPFNGCLNLVHEKNSFIFNSLDELELYLASNFKDPFFNLLLPLKKEGK